MLPETVCLADHDLGHDDRASNPQPVRSRLGERFYPWQLEQSVEESWAECERHARNLLGSDGYAQLKAELESASEEYPTLQSAASVAAERAESSGTAQKRLFPGRPSLFDDGTEDPI